LRVVAATKHALAMAASASTDTTDEPKEASPEEIIESVGIDFPRPNGKRFGKLVHDVLSVVDLNADATEIQAAADLRGRILGATPEEIIAATETVIRALAHPLMRRAAAASLAGRCRRETPITMQLEDGTLIEGVVDLAFVDESDLETWIVVDFKTDFEISGRLEEYLNQVALYGLAISRATGSETIVKLLRV
jgi:ATP-dependent exoDNAse (exonuclease V) beta subunit